MWAEALASSPWRFTSTPFKFNEILKQCNAKGFQRRTSTGEEAALVCHERWTPGAADRTISAAVYGPLWAKVTSQSLTCSTHSFSSCHQTETMEKLLSITNRFGTSILKWSVHTNDKTHFILTETGFICPWESCHWTYLVCGARRNKTETMSSSFSDQQTFT